MSLMYWAGTQEPTSAEVTTLLAQTFGASTINELDIVLDYLGSRLGSDKERDTQLDGDPASPLLEWAHSENMTEEQLIEMSSQTLGNSTRNDIKKFKAWACQNISSKQNLTGTMMSKIPTGAVAAVAGFTPGHVYGTGQKIHIDVTFNCLVTVTAVPSILVTIGAGTGSATYVSGSGTATLAFEYTVLTADTCEVGGVDLSGVIVGTIKDAFARDVSKTFTTPAVVASLSVNPLNRLVSITGITNGAHWITGNVISLTVQWTNPVTVTPSPTIPLAIAANNRNLTYASGTGTTTCVFSYTIVAGDVAVAGGVVLTGTITGTIVDANGRAVQKGFAAPPTNTVTVN